MDTWFDLKAIEFFGRQCVILCQNENGPCPLLAIANVLILQNAIFVHPDKRCIALNELIEIVANAFVEKDASRSHESDVRKDSRQHQLNSVLNIIPNMARGLDLNVLFSGVNAFEFTEEISVFDALDIPLLHGWVLDPQDMVTSSVIKTNDSYNHLMFKLVEYRSIQERVTSCSRKFESESKTDSTANSAPKEKSNVDLIEFSSSPDPIVPSGLQTSESWEAVSATENTDSSPYVIIPTGQGTVVTNPSTQSKNVPALKDGELSTAAALTSVVDASHGGSEGIASSQTAVLAADSFFPPAPPAVENRKDLSPEDIELCKEGEVIEAFLASTAAQLTYIGLAALHQILQERQLAVFFRNNHFSTIFRNNGKLYLLVTDMGYQNVESVVWERLDDIDG
jgi:ubiquitin carboxyl-terminal hydrolase MINDY-1/2